jgi:hypothetical protein
MPPLAAGGHHGEPARVQLGGQAVEAEAAVGVDRRLPDAGVVRVVRRIAEQLADAGEVGDRPSGHAEAAPGQRRAARQYELHRVRGEGVDLAVVLVTHLRQDAADHLGAPRCPRDQHHVLAAGLTQRIRVAGDGREQPTIGVGDAEQALAVVVEAVDAVGLLGQQAADPLRDAHAGQRRAGLVDDTHRHPLRRRHVQPGTFTRSDQQRRPIGEPHFDLRIGLRRHQQPIPGRQHELSFGRRPRRHLHEAQRPADLAPGVGTTHAEVRRQPPLRAAQLEHCTGREVADHWRTADDPSRLLRRLRPGDVAQPRVEVGAGPASCVALHLQQVEIADGTGQARHRTGERDHGAGERLARGVGDQHERRPPRSGPLGQHRGTQRRHRERLRPSLRHGAQYAAPATAAGPASVRIRDMPMFSTCGPRS